SADLADRAAQSGPAWLEQLLQAEPEQAAGGSAGWLGAAVATQCAVAALEATGYPGTQSDAPGFTGGAGLEVGHQRARPLVERRCPAPAAGAAEEVLGRAWTGVDTGYDHSA